MVIIMDENAVVKFGEIFPGGGEMLEGDRTKPSEMIDKKFIILEFKSVHDQFGKTPDSLVTVVQALENNKKKVFFTRSGVLRGQLDAIKDKLPVEVTLRRKKNYLTFE